MNKTQKYDTKLYARIFLFAVYYRLSTNYFFLFPLVCFDAFTFFCGRKFF